MKELNVKYGIDTHLYADIGTVILLVLSDSIGYLISFQPIIYSEDFVNICPSWICLLSKALKTLIDLGCMLFSKIALSSIHSFLLSCIVDHNAYGSFSLREMMQQLGQPYIEWSDGILSTGYNLVDRQHHWLLTIVNISFRNGCNRVELFVACNCFAANSFLSFIHSFIYSLVFFNSKLLSMWTLAIKHISAWMMC